MESTDDMNMVEELRHLFRRISDIQYELKEIDHDKYLEFREENTKISDLEFYDLKKVIKKGDYHSIDTLKMRKSLLEKWEKELLRLTDKT